MSTKKVLQFPTCNFCGADAHYDAPMIGHGSWAYFCPDCWSERGSHDVYTKFVLKDEADLLHDQLGGSDYSADLEAEFMSGLDLEHVMAESMFGDACGVEVADGCMVEPDGKCCHGYSSPLLLAGLI